ncbi:MAG: hypothetical protein KDB96_14555 [Flavobacteriales bacterium]|nr:hypothetical protein [Flavobacteriales bacterium]HPF92153.1 hypothetical protein [Flavobacteriales bacterium]
MRTRRDRRRSTTAFKVEVVLEPLANAQDLSVFPQAFRAHDELIGH